MGYIPTQQQNTGLYVPTTQIWDIINQLAQEDFGTESYKQLQVQLYQKIGEMAIVLNKKDSAYYLMEEFVNGQQFFNPQSSSPDDLRPCYRIVVSSIGTFSAGITTISHNIMINSSTTFTFIAGAASNTSTLVYYPLPFAGTSNNNISVTVDATSVYINNQSGIVFTNYYICLEYLKS